MRKVMIMLAVSVLVAFAALPASAEEGAQVSVIHGIPGLTVDVFVNGALTLEGF